MNGLRARARAATESPEPALAVRPRLAGDVLVHEPAEDGAPWIVQFAGQRYVRIGATMARILRSADGTRTPEEIARELGTPWTAELVGQGLLNAQRLRLLDDGRAPARGSRRWFRFIPPLTFQFTLLDPDSALRRVRPLTAGLARRGWAAVMVAVIVAGLVGLAAQASTVRDLLGRPLPVAAFLIAFAATVIGTALHELAHGLVLSYYGGRPSRIGMMLFYLTPAFFCDVSDGWRLPRSRQRVRVALAGVATQAVIGGLAAAGAIVATAVIGGGALSDGLYLISLSSYAAALFNLLPFVKLDGYLALMSHLDVPHLRERSMAEARHAIARILFGGRYPRDLPDLPWARWYGAASLAFPVYVLGMALTLWQSLLVGTGLVGVVAVVAVLGYLLVRGYAAALRLIREALAAGARRSRVLLVSSLLAGLAWALLQTVTLPYSVNGAYVRDGNQVTFVMLAGTDRAAITPGASVQLRRSGVLVHSGEGRAVVAGTQRRTVSVPLTAFAPVSGLDAVRVDAVGLDLVTRQPPPDSTGTAVVAAGRRPLGEWLYLRYLAPFWR